MSLGIRSVLNAIRHHFVDEKTLNQQFAQLRSASKEVVESKRKLDQTLSHVHNQDQFQIFAEGARKAHF